jgi:hypothetical protein
MICSFLPSLIHMVTLSVLPFQINNVFNIYVYSLPHASVANPLLDNHVES